jgi:hypothetical protein
MTTSGFQAPGADRVAALDLDGQRLEQHQGAEDGQHDAQAEREVARPGRAELPKL